jgi:hypothetical protein
MLSGRVRILDFDRSLALQEQLLRRFNPDIIDLTGIGPHCRLWAARKDAEKIRALLNPKQRNAITFLGSGDFHHISGLLIKQFSEPINLIVFDFHPDWDILPPRLGCGSWVTNALTNSNIKKVILLGASSADISGMGIQTANLSSLAGRRVEIYPYAHKPTPVLFRDVPQDGSLKIRKFFWGREIIWKELKGLDLGDFCASLAEGLPVKQTYISIDKDCLREEYALTNWDQGQISLDELLIMLKVFRQSLDVVGVDVTGDYSLPSFKSRIKGFFSRLDHPKDIAARRINPQLLNLVNQSTNIKILEALGA